MRFDLADGFPLLTTEEGPPQVDHPRAALVPARRHEHRVPEGARRQDLGRVGRRRPASSGRSTATVALLADGRRRRTSTSRARDRRDPRATRTRAGLIVSAWNVGRHPADGARRRATCCSSSTSPTAGSRASSTSARPTCSSACRSTSPSYALLTHMVAQVTGLEARRLRPHVRRRAPLREPPRAGPRAARPRAAAAADAAAQPRRARRSTSSASTTSRSRLRPAPGDSGADRRMTAHAASPPSPGTASSATTASCPWHLPAICNTSRR